MPKGEERAAELKRIADCAALAVKNGIEPHAGHGLTFDNVVPVAAIPQIAELNIGHFLIGEAIFTGLDAERPPNARADGRGAMMPLSAAGWGGGPLGKGSGEGRGCRAFAPSTRPRFGSTLSRDGWREAS